MLGQDVLDHRGRGGQGACVFQQVGRSAKTCHHALEALGHVAAGQACLELAFGVLFGRRQSAGQQRKGLPTSAARTAR